MTTLHTIQRHNAHREFTVDSDWDMIMADGTELEPGSELTVHALVDGDELLGTGPDCIVALLEGEPVAHNARLVTAVEECVARWGYMPGA